jgi:hypothetical protein
MLRRGLDNRTPTRPIERNLVADVAVVVGP